MPLQLFAWTETASGHDNNGFNTSHDSQSNKFFRAGNLWISTCTAKPMVGTAGFWSLYYGDVGKCRIPCSLSAQYHLTLISGNGNKAFDWVCVCHFTLNDFDRFWVRYVVYNEFTIWYALCLVSLVCCGFDIIFIIFYEKSRRKYLYTNRLAKPASGLTHLPLNKCPPFRRRYFHMHFSWILIKFSLKSVPNGPIDNIQRWFR